MWIVCACLILIAFQPYHEQMKDLNPFTVPSQIPENEVQTISPAEPASKKLIVYFYYSGNTQKVANWIAAYTRADLLQIETRKPRSHILTIIISALSALKLNIMKMHVRK